MLKDIQSAISTTETSNYMISFAFWMIIFALLSVYLKEEAFAFAFGVVSITASIVSVVFTEKERDRRW